MTAFPRPVTGVGQPGWKLLNIYAALLIDAFPGVEVYLTGSASVSKTWRDVDVRVLMPDALYRRYIGDEVTEQKITRRRRGVEVETRRTLAEDQRLASVAPLGRRRTAIELAWCSLGRELTGLPIDVQFMTDRYAQKCFAGQHSERIGRRVI